MLDKLSKRERNILFVTVAFLVVVGGYLWVYQNLVIMWDDLSREIVLNEQLLRVKKKNYRETARIEKRYDAVVASLKIDGNESDKQLKIQEELSDLMQQAGVVPKNTTPKAFEEAENFQIFNFAYSDAETGMADLVKFFGLLEENSRVSEIQKIEIKEPSPKLYKLDEQRFKTNYEISRLVYRSKR